MAAVAFHMREYRLRKKAGKVVLQIEVDEVGLARALVRMEVLNPKDEDDRDAVEQALERFLERRYGERKLTITAEVKKVVATEEVATRASEFVALAKFLMAARGSVAQPVDLSG
jgi:hypothetical protein